MDRIAGIGIIVMGLVLSLATAARAEGIGGIPYGEDCWGTGTDADGDGLEDACEQQLASSFMPLMWFEKGESGSARRPYFAVKNHSFAARTVQIFYMDAYREDTGIVTGHDGDSEFQIIEVHYSGGRWYTDWMYMSAHHQSICDSSAWYGHDQLAYDTGSDRPNASRGWPTIYAAEDKHATYNSLDTCDDGCMYLDSCGRNKAEYLDPEGALSGRNVGSTAVKLINEVIVNGSTEYLLESGEFKGWDDRWYEPNSAGYQPFMVPFGF